MSREIKASWPIARDGLEQMRKKYPDSLEIPSVSAKMSALAVGRALAKALFDQLDDRYVPDISRKPERFAYYWHRAQTGQWYQRSDASRDGSEQRRRCWSEVVLGSGNARG